MKNADRFAFGKNWRSFLDSLSEDRIEQAIKSLQTSLQTKDLEGRRFLDLGSGSGLFSLAANRMGATVVSVDFDPQSVACTQSLKDTCGDDSRSWDIHQGSVLDSDLMNQLGSFDVVYSWGVLHHTSDLCRAIQLASQRTSADGLFFIAIYNDQGRSSRQWLRIKQVYHRLPSGLRPMWVGLIASIYESKFAIARLVSLQNPLPFADWRAKKQDRGMSVWHDWVDWIGGLPFEVATPDQIINLLCQTDFLLQRIKTVGNGWGCNEYVFRRLSDPGEIEDPPESDPGRLAR